MRCPNCRAETTAGEKFCPNCGSPLLDACPACDAAAQCGAPLQLQAAAKPSALLPTGPAVPPAPPVHPITGYQRRLVTILFADIVGFSTLAETIDPERAIAAGVEITARSQAYAAQLRQERGIPAIDVRVEINTGLVVVGEVSPDQRLEYSVLGDTVNPAARLQQNALPGGVLVSRETYRHVRGLFTVQPQEPVTVKGRQQVVGIYLVRYAKPGHWRLCMRGVEGIDTLMICREPELLALQNVFQDAIQQPEQIPIPDILFGSYVFGKLYQHQVIMPEQLQILFTISTHIALIVQLSSFRIDVRIGIYAPLPVSYN